VPAGWLSWMCFVRKTNPSAPKPASGLRGLFIGVGSQQWAVGS